MAGEQSSPHDAFLLDLSESGTSKGDSGLLLESLRERGIRTFTVEDGEEHEHLTPRGDEITPALITAVEASKIAIVVVTGGYRDVSLRRWKVLAYIHDYLPRSPRFIIPIYYMDRSAAHADPVSFDEPSPFDTPKKYRAETGNNEYKLSRVMAQLDNLPGWDYDWHVKNKDEFNREIASQLSKMLNRAPLDVAIYPVGLQSRLEEVWWLLKLTSSNREFVNIGFYGMQGIGKSTLARVVYNSIAHLFEVSCFLHSIRQISNTHGLVGIQKMLLSEIFGETGIQLENVDEGVSIIKDSLRKKDILLVIDDVDSLDQLEALGRGSGWWFSSGSRVIITTRDKHLLTYHGHDMLLYDVQALNHKDALELLCHRAFEHGNVDPRYTEVLNRAIGYASGLPLVLDMIGSYWYGKSLDECENALDRLERIPLNDIQRIQGALTYKDIQTIQCDLTTSQSEVSQISLSVSEVFQTSLIDPEGSQTTRVAGAMLWRLVCLASGGVGLLCNALCPPFKRLIGGWNPLKLFLYVVFSLGVWAIILCSNRSQIFHRFKCYICYGVFLGILLYSYFYDKAMDGEPEILFVVSNAAFALASLSLSKLFEAGFETDMFSYFLGCFTVHLFAINWKLIFVAIIIGGPLFVLHLYSAPFLFTRIIRWLSSISQKKSAPLTREGVKKMAREIMVWGS